MIKGKLESGFEYEIDEAILGDWKMLKLLRGIDKGNASLIVDVVDMLFGDDVDKLEAHLEKDGKLTVEAMVEAVTEIFEQHTETKNS